MTLTDVVVPRRNWLVRLGAGWKIVAIFAIFGMVTLFTVRFVLFQSQVVRVEKVEFLCYAKLHKRRQLPIGKIVATELTADRKGVKKFVEQQYRGRRHRRWHVVPGTYASFRYLSPVDAVVHLGRIKRHNNDQGQPIKVGDHIVIHASRLGAESYADFVSPTWP